VPGALSGAVSKGLVRKGDGMDRVLEGKRSRKKIPAKKKPHTTRGVCSST
jgi:hypothetical protein